MICPICNKEMISSDGYNHYKINNDSLIYTCNYDNNYRHSWLHLNNNKIIDYIFNFENIRFIHVVEDIPLKTLIFNDKMQKYEIEYIQFDKENLSEQLNNLITKIERLKVFL